jgi:hypothetical protein
MSLLQEMETYGLANETLSERARLNLARYLLAYLDEERARGVKRADEWTIADAIEAWQGGAR